MHSTGSIIKTYCEKVRHYLDDPDLDAKYDDNYLVRFFLPSAMTDVISRVSQMSDAQILSSFTLSLTAGTSSYKLPPAVAQVVRIGTIEPASGLFYDDLKPRGQFNPNGPNWTLQGNTLVFQPSVQETKEYTLVFVPSGDIMCQYTAADPVSLVQSINSNGTFTMANTPTIGSYDKRPNAYLGSYLRVLGNVVDEVLVSDHDVSLKVLTPTTAFENPVAAGYSYEIVPFLMEPMIDAVSVSAAMRAGVGRKINQAHMQALMLAYKQAIKTAHDTLANMNGRIGKAFNGNTIDSTNLYVGPSYQSSGTGGTSGGGTAGCDCNDVASETVQQQIIVTLDQLALDLADLATQGVDGETWT